MELIRHWTEYISKERAWNEQYSVELKQIDRANGTADGHVNKIQNGRKELERDWVRRFGQSNIPLDRKYLILHQEKTHSDLFAHNIEVILIHSPLPLTVRSQVTSHLHRYPLILPAYEVKQACFSGPTTLSHSNDIHLLHRAWRRLTEPSAHELELAALYSTLIVTVAESIWFRQQELKTNPMNFSQIRDWLADHLAPPSKHKNVTRDKHKTVETVDSAQLVHHELSSWSTDLLDRLASRHAQVSYAAFRTPLEIVLATLRYAYAVLLTTTQVKDARDWIMDTLRAIWFPILVETTDTDAHTIWTKWLQQPGATLPHVRQERSVRAAQQLKRDLIQWASLAHLHSIGTFAQMRRSVSLLFLFGLSMT